LYKCGEILTDQQATKCASIEDLDIQESGRNRLLFLRGALEVIASQGSKENSRIKRYRYQIYVGINTLRGASELEVSIPKLRDFCDQLSAQLTIMEDSLKASGLGEVHELLDDDLMEPGSTFMDIADHESRVEQLKVLICSWEETISERDYLVEHILEA